MHARIVHSLVAVSLEEVVGWRLIKLIIMRRVNMLPISTMFSQIISTVERVIKDIQVAAYRTTSYFVLQP